MASACVEGCLSLAGARSVTDDHPSPRQWMRRRASPVIVIRAPIRIAYFDAVAGRLKLILPVEHMFLVREREGVLSNSRRDF